MIEIQFSVFIILCYWKYYLSKYLTWRGESQNSWRYKNEKDLWKLLLEKIARNCVGDVIVSRLLDCGEYNII